MKQANCLITVATVLCVALANAGVLQAVHLHQHRLCRDASAASRPGGKEHAGSTHDPSKCSFCIQFASGRAVPLHFAEHITLTVEPAEELVSSATFLLPSVSLTSLPARAPPLFC